MITSIKKYINKFKHKRFLKQYDNLYLVKLYVRFIKKNGYTECVREFHSCFKKPTVESLGDTLWSPYAYDWVNLVNKFKKFYVAHLLIVFLQKHKCLDILEEITVYKNKDTLITDVKEKAIVLVERRGVYDCIFLLLLKSIRISDQDMKKIQYNWNKFIQKKIKKEKSFNIIF